jgi:hypothetical protein
MFIMDRQIAINNYGPDRYYVGEGGFHDYVAYEFTARGIVVMESFRRDNAIYVFGDDWAKVSKLTKAEVLSNKFHRERIIHSSRYKDRLSDLFHVADAV